MSYLMDTYTIALKRVNTANPDNKHYSMHLWNTIYTDTAKEPSREECDRWYNSMDRLIRKGWGHNGTLRVVKYTNASPLGYITYANRKNSIEIEDNMGLLLDTLLVYIAYIKLHKIDGLHVSRAVIYNGGVYDKDTVSIFGKDMMGKSIRVTYFQYTLTRLLAKHNVHGLNMDDCIDLIGVAND